MDGTSFELVDVTGEFTFDEFCSLEDVASFLERLNRDSFGRVHEVKFKKTLAHSHQPYRVLPQHRSSFDYPLLRYRVREVREVAEVC